jgi:hypothetical protein
MPRRLALLALIAALSSCGRDDQIPVSTSQGVQAEKPVALSPQQIEERTAGCRERARAEYRATRRTSAGQAPEGLVTTGYALHYNARLDTCFYLQTVSYPASALRRTLVDINEREVYGEYLGQVEGGAPGARIPDSCSVAGIYCASENEWELLARNFMAD